MIRMIERDDIDPVYRLHVDAFGEDEHDNVAQLAVDLLREGSAKPDNAFVALKKNRIVGCVIFSCIDIQGSAPVKAMILAPLAVSSKHQRAGIGTALVQHGLAILRSQGVDILFVYGDPNYYSRFGFATGHQVAAPFPLKYPRGWLACELTENALPSTSCMAKCVKALCRPEYW
jgi:putative acetyltransferase